MDELLKQAPDNISKEEIESIYLRNNKNVYSLTPKWVKDKLDQYQIPKVIKPDTDDTPVKYNENPTWSTDRIKKKSLYDKFD